MVEDAQMKIRLPRPLKERIEASANANNRSWNGEIVARLEASLQEPATVNTAELEKRLRSIEWRLAKIEGRLQAEETQADERPLSLAELHGAKKLIE